MEKEKPSQKDNTASEPPQALEESLLGSVLARRPRGEKIPRKPAQRPIILPESAAPRPSTGSGRGGKARRGKPKGIG